MDPKKLTSLLTTAVAITLTITACSTAPIKNTNTIPSDSSTVKLSRAEEEEQKRIAEKQALLRRMSELKGKKYQINKEANEKLQKIQNEKYNTKSRDKDSEPLEQESSIEYKKLELRKSIKKSAAKMKSKPMMALCEAAPTGMMYDMAIAPPISTQQQFNTEEYSRIYENSFLKVVNEPLSTFSIDVDAASYSNMRRFLNNNQLPPKDAVRIEEMINYFNYDYPAPQGEDPFSITTEVSGCPWKKEHKLVHIGLQGEKITSDSLPPANLVFLLDVSGSMNSANKLPLLKSALKMLTKNLRSQDKVSIVVYAGAAGLVLPSTDGSNTHKITEALDRLNAGGSTAGGAGIQLAYKVAKQNFITGGNNRVILATDGDFNVGTSSSSDLVRMIEQKREDGIFLTVLGFGNGNYKDSRMEQLADKGNGNYAYIDNLLEAKKVLVTEMGSTLLTIAKDVKIQVEFNPSVVQAYRLIGYENRKLKNEDFNDDKKDAGELGAGHSVTALYEIVPTGVKMDLPKVDELKYQKTKPIKAISGPSKEILTVKFRYKKPTGSKSKLLVNVLRNRTDEKHSENLYFSAAVAGFGMLLRDSQYKGDLTFDKIIKMAKEAKGADDNGYRAEFIRLVEQAQLLSPAKS